MQQIVFGTSNQHKYEEAKTILSEFKVIKKKIEVIEIQGTIKEVVSHKALSAFKELGEECFVEDTSLCFESWGELPGPYIKPFLLNIGPDGLFKALSGFGNMKAKAVASLGFMNSKLDKPVIFQGIVSGTITSPKGSSGFEWDQIFIPDGYDRTFAELGMEVKNKISHRKEALFQLREYLISHF